VGLFIILFCFYTWLFISGTPTIRVDYVAQLNQISRPEVADEDNAWPHYEKAADLYVEPDESIKDQIRILDKSQEGYKDFSQFTEAEQKALLEWMEQNQPAWNEYVTGSQKRYCWIRYQAENNCMLDVITPKLGHLRGLTRLAIWQAWIHFNQTQTDKALELCLVILRVGNHLQKEKGTIVGQLVGLGISKIGYSELISLSQQTDVTLSKWEQIQNELETLYKSGYPLMDVASERLFFLDIIQRVFTDGGIGGGHLLPNEMLEKLIGVGNNYEETEERVRLIGLGLIHANREETIKKANAIYDLLEKISKMTPYEIHKENINYEKEIQHLSYRYFLVRTLIPALQRVGELSFRGKAMHEATLTVLALRRRQMEKGAYPEKLEELVTEGYLRQLPEDPYSDSILRYEKRGDDFILYSLGRNFVDDGGVQHPEVNFEWGDIDKVGDRVFWPVSQ